MHWIFRGSKDTIAALFFSIFSGPNCTIWVIKNHCHYHIVERFISWTPTFRGISKYPIIQYVWFYFLEHNKNVEFDRSSNFSENGHIFNILNITNPAFNKQIGVGIGLQDLHYDYINIDSNGMRTQTKTDGFLKRTFIFIFTLHNFCVKNSHDFLAQNILKSQIHILPDEREWGAFSSTHQRFKIFTVRFDPLNSCFGGMSRKSKWSLGSYLTVKKINKNNKFVNFLEFLEKDNEIAFLDFDFTEWVELAFPIYIST